MTITYVSFNHLHISCYRDILYHTHSIRVDTSNNRIHNNAMLTSRLHFVRRYTETCKQDETFTSLTALHYLDIRISSTDNMHKPLGIVNGGVLISVFVLISLNSIIIYTTYRK